MHGYQAARRRARAALGLGRRAFDPAENPFLASELRRQARRHTLSVSLLLHLLGLSLLFAFLLWIGWQPSSPFWGPVQHFLRPQLVTAIAAVHGWLVVYASVSRVRESAQREETMWEMLVVTPLSAVEIVLFKSVYPFLYAGLITLAMLPLYLLAAAISGDSVVLLLMLFFAYGLVSIRLVTPLRPIRPRRLARRPRSRSGGSYGGSYILWLWAWLWLLSWTGLALLPLSPLAGALFFTWPVVTASILPTPYPFFRLGLPPLVALLALGPPLFLLNLQTSAAQLAARITETPVPAISSRLHRGLILGTVIVILGYAWPRLIEAGNLAAWMQFAPNPAGSISALGWLLLAGWWLLHGANSLLTVPVPRTWAGARHSPAKAGGRPDQGSATRGPLAGVAGFFTPPLLLLGIGCLLAGRFPLAMLAWFVRLLLVAAAAAWLTLVLQRWVRDATLARQRIDVAAAWLAVCLFLIAPLLLLFWPDRSTLRLAAVSPVVGFLLLLPPKAALSLATLGPLPPWWLPAALNAGSASLLWHLNPVRVRAVGSALPAAPRTRAPVKRQTSRGVIGPWVARWMAQYDNPVLLQEWRLYLRRGGGSYEFGWLTVGAIACLVAALPVVLLLYDTGIGDYAPGGVRLRDYLQMVTGLAAAIPLRLFSSDLAGVRLFFASVMALLLVALSWPTLLRAPLQGAMTFSQERRKETLDFLLLTPLTEGEIVRGKLLGAAAPLLHALALVFPVAALAALLSFSLAAIWALLFTFTWLLIAALAGTALGTLATLLLRGKSDPHGPPLLAVILLQVLKLYAVARCQYLIAGVSWASSKLEITAWYVVPLVALEAGIGYLSYAASIAALTHARRTEKRAVRRSMETVKETRSW